MIFHLWLKILRLMLAVTFYSSYQIYVCSLEFISSISTF